MVSFTPIYSWPIPSLADIADGPDAFADALNAIEATSVADQVLSYTPTWSGALAAPASPSAIAGRYRVQNGMCDLWIGMTFGASTSGGSGSLTLSVPIAARVGIAEQWLPAKTFVPGGSGGNYFGSAFIVTGGSLIYPHFPTSASDCRVKNWAGEASVGSGTGTGVPAVPGNYTVGNGGNFYLSGRYII